MADPKQNFFDKRAQVLLKNLHSRHFDACYCRTREEALKAALAWIPEGSSVGWGGALSAQQIGLQDAIKAGSYQVIDRDTAANPREKDELQHKCLSADYFICGANAISIDGQMVNVDGVGNRVAAIVYGPRNIIVVAGMNKVVDSLEAAVTRARTIAAPMNKQRFAPESPCNATATCADCKSDGCICNQILITRNSKPAGRIKVILVGEELGL